MSACEEVRRLAPRSRRGDALEKRRVDYAETKEKTTKAKATTRNGKKNEKKRKDRGSRCRRPPPRAVIILTAAPLHRIRYATPVAKLEDASRAFPPTFLAVFVFIILPLFVTVEPEHLLQQQDFLTCGVCQKEFALSDIVRFIQHKVHSCNKENCLLFDGSPGEDDFDADRPDLPVGSAAASANSNAVGAVTGSTPTSRRCPGSGSQVSALSSLKRSHHHGSSGGTSVTASSTTSSSSHHHHHHRLAHNNIGSVTNSNSNHSLDLADRLKARVSLEPHLHKYGSSTTSGGGGAFGAASRTGSGGGLLVNDSNGGGGGVASPTSPAEGHAVVSGVGPGAGVPLVKSPPASSVSPVRRPASTVDVGVNTTYTDFVQARDFAAVLRRSFAP
ncbi:hypothetical protein HPB50_013087 [Hyalomma asiaticum]|uniref:Uncharacterized protein n=1 Tax=Hyalomma asiaticum TaxID=266040 RepID=A0ACB7RT00_HYAAI|nr:hypothetical protein HPB50_013087 [Hyalomma asiaticum]